MNRQKKQLLAAVIILILLVAGYFTINLWQKNKPVEGEETQTYAVTEIKTEDITSVSYQSSDYHYTFEKNGEVWKCKEDASLNIDSAQVEAIITTVTNMLSKQKIENPQNLDDYGLTNPQKTVILTSKDGSNTFRFGDLNALTSEYYLRLNEENTVYMAEQRVVTTFEKPVSDFVKEEVTTEEVTAQAAE